jgi:hypothetical protein
MGLQMVECSQKDADNLARVKDVMLAKALEGDAHAASAFVTVLIAQKELGINKEVSKSDAADVPKVDPLKKWERPAPSAQR